VVVALLAGALLAGCGGGKSKTQASSAARTGSTGLTPQQRVEACTRIVQAPSALPASTKAKLLKTCAKVGTSPLAEHVLVHELCIALASRQPAGAPRERALAICQRVP
jgi:hypothetical protein